MPSLESNDLFSVGKYNAVQIGASPNNQRRVTNTNGGKLFWKNTSAVTTSDAEIAVGASVSFEETVWLISETESRVIVTTGTGVPSSSPVPGFYGGQWNPVAATSGTDTTPAEKKLYLISLFLPVSKKIKGIGYLVGSVGGTNKVIAGLYSSTGVLLANSSQTTEGATVGTAAEMQELDLTATYTAQGPGVYFIGITMNGNTARLRTIPKNVAGANIAAGEVTLGTKNVLANVTVPSTFTADKAPVCWVY